MCFTLIVGTQTWTIFSQNVFKNPFVLVMEMIFFFETKLHLVSCSVYFLICRLFFNLLPLKTLIVELFLKFVFYYFYLKIKSNTYYYMYNIS